jgi:hypothetical protein
MRALYKGTIFELDEYEEELATSEDVADRIALQVRLEIRKAGGDPDTVVVTETAYESGDDVVVKDVKYEYLTRWGDKE